MAETTGSGVLHGELDGKAIAWTLEPQDGLGARAIRWKSAGQQGMLS